MIVAVARDEPRQRQRSQSMWRRLSGGCTILQAPHLRRTDMHPSRCLSGAQRTARAAHWAS
eukprot:849750-Prymnesium_polylepis.1